MQISLSVAFLLHHPALKNYQNTKNCCFYKYTSLAIFIVMVVLLQMGLLATVNISVDRI